MTDIKVYYHKSFAFEVVASCIALVAVLCVQLLWPSHFLLHWLGLGTDILYFKFGLLAVHLLWIIFNLAGLANFIAITFGFVQQSERELLRERYTANVVHPRDMTARLRQHLYGIAGRELIADTDKRDGGHPSAAFGFDFGEPQTIELSSHLRRPVALHDVRMRWVRWVLLRWTERCVKAPEERPANSHGLGHQGPLIWFTPHLDTPLRGTVGWCRRRGGVPLTSIEKLVLRRAFLFRRTGDDA